jgi:hypothetical protein
VEKDIKELRLQQEKAPRHKDKLVEGRVLHPQAVSSLFNTQGKNSKEAF